MCFSQSLKPARHHTAQRRWERAADRGDIVVAGVGHREQSSRKRASAEAVLDYFNKRPINIIEIGCARNLDINSRQSDGWSTCFWADYVNATSGWLEVYDTNEESLKNCKQIVNCWMAKPDFDHSYDIKFYCENCKDFEDVELVFLDGGDDPNETLDQFNKCKKAETEVILIDDFHTKGRLVIDKPDTLWHFENGHELACFGGPKLGRIELKLL